MRGSVTRRGRRSFRIKFDIDRVAGRRQTRYETVKGTRADAERELTRRPHEIHTGTAVDPSDITVGDWLHKWLDKQRLSPGSHETVAFAVQRLVAEIGSVKLQKLRPAHVHDLKLLKRDGTPISPSTERETRRILKAALQSACDIELIARNAGAVGRRVAGEDAEVVIMQPEEIRPVLEALRGSPLYTITVLALAAGVRRGELLALRWQDLDLDHANITVERSLEKTIKLGYRFKTTKTRRGRRNVSLPASAVVELELHRIRQLELRMKLGMGRPAPDGLVFCHHDGSNLVPNSVTRWWREAVEGRWKFHALRHTHASALIAEGIDPVTLCARLGHASPAITMRVYAHQFRARKLDTTAADAIEKLFKG